MTDLSTTNLKHLLDQATPGPWEYIAGDSPDGRCIANPGSMTMCIGVDANGKGSSCEDADLNLAATAPELAEEVIRLREELIDWANDEARAHNALVKRAQEAGGAGIITTHKTIYNRIWEILGDHDE